MIYEVFVYEGGVITMKSKTKGMVLFFAAVLIVSTLFGNTATASTIVNSGRTGTINVLEGNGGTYIKGQRSEYKIVLDMPFADFVEHFQDVRVYKDGTTDVYAVIPYEQVTLNGASAKQIMDQQEDKKPRPAATEDAADSSEAPAVTTKTPAKTPEPPATTSLAPATTSETPPATSETPSEAPVASDAPQEPDVSVQPNIVVIAPSLSASQGILQSGILAPLDVHAEEEKATVAISTDFLNTLNDGVYTFSVQLDNGEAVAAVTVASNATSPATGDTTHMILYVALAACSAGVLIFLGKKKRAEA